MAEEEKRVVRQGPSGERVEYTFHVVIVVRGQEVDEQRIVKLIHAELDKLTCALRHKGP